MIQSLSKKDIKKTKKLRIGTAFSGIGAFEQAIELLGFPHELVFACDNGGILLEDIIKPEETKELEKIKNPLKRQEFVESIYKKTKRRTNFVKKSYLANYDLAENKFYHDVRFLGNHINQTKDKDYLDIFVGGSPCQSFSMAGERGGFEDTRGTLFFEFARCVKEFQPKVFIYENVKGLISHDKGKTFATVLNTFNELGYKYYYQVLNAKDYGIPQSRQRIFVVGFRDLNDKNELNFEFPNPIKLKYNMSDFLIGKTDGVLKLVDESLNFNRSNLEYSKNKDINNIIKHENKVDEKYYMSEKLIKTVMATSAGTMTFKPTINTEIAKTLLATMHKMHRASMDNYVTTNGRLRRLTPRECLRLMGFSDRFSQVVSDMQMYKQAGNSIVVDVLAFIMIEILKTTKLKI
jgi:DNA (cytosine-5)-methyltransferase 1